jgi:hypothetical protein
MTDSVKQEPDVGNTGEVQAVAEAESTEEAPAVPGAGNTEEVPPSTDAEAVPPKPDEPSVENPEEKKPAAEYDIVPSKRLEPEGDIAPNHYRPMVTAAGGQGQGGQGNSTPEKAPSLRARLTDASIDQIGKLASSQTRVYAAIGVGLGLLVGLVAAVIFLHPGGSGGATDMGSVNANEYGLKGNLTAEWKDKLEYHLTVAASAPEQGAGFLANVTSSPRPLSISIQMKDPFGTVLCGDTILLKYDPRNAPGMVVGEPGPTATKAEQAIATRNQIAQGINLARLEGQELDREHDKTLFQDDVSPVGQVTSISAQGILPCTKQQFDNVASWGLTTNFPNVVQPVTSANSGLNPKAAGEPSGGDETSEKKPEARKATEDGRVKRRPALPEPPIYIEGDDAIMLVDPSNGVIETREGKTLMLDKSDPILNALKGQDFPIPIHYRCDQTGNCTVAGVNTGVHRARLKQ